MKLQLPTVTLLIADCLDAELAAKVLELCKAKADFGAVKLLTSLPIDNPHRVEIIPLNSLIAYSVFMLTRVHQYVNTTHLLTVQRDGWILNSDAWNPEWLNLDYIGPLFVQYDKVGSGGFSLRSKRIMQATAKQVVPWDGSQIHAEIIQKGLGLYEDGIISLSPFRHGFKIATLEQAANFAQGGNRNPKYFKEYPFGYHRTWQQIDFTTGRVDSSDTSRDLQSSYHHEIDKL